ncbi:MAG: T9SS type A sorting domain-containing protein [Saprospiraceae bacterium]|nr:T9SS type A sorting domain-containing protein [Saprospiraceae bacterium]
MQHLIAAVNTSGEIDLIGLAPGLYFVQLEINSKLFTFKMIKQ